MLNHLSQQERSVEEFRDGLKQRNPLIRGRGGVKGYCSTPSFFVVVPMACISFLVAPLYSSLFQLTCMCTYPLLQAA